MTLPDEKTFDRGAAQGSLDAYWIEGECSLCRKPSSGHYADCPIDALSLALAHIETLEKTGQDLLDILAAEMGDVLVSLKVAERVLAFKAALRREEET